MHQSIGNTLNQSLENNSSKEDFESKASPVRSKILVIDDSPDNLRVLSAALAENNYDVRCAKSSAIAFKTMEVDLPDLILLDVRMPEMDGYEMCDRLKANAATRNIPIIFISALDTAFDKVKAFTSGGVDYITKPFQVEEVLARVKNHLELKSALTKLDQINANLEKRVQERTQQLQAMNYRLRISEERLESILNTLQDIIWSASFEPFQILYLNPAAAEIFQRPIEDFFHHSDLWTEVIHPDDRAEVWESIHALTSRGSLDIEYRIVQATGDIRWVRNRSRLVISNDAVAIRIEGIITDISDRKRAEQQLIHDALHDALTQLPNRTLFVERIENALGRRLRHPDCTFAVLFLDLDRFKVVNDSLGHRAGDRLLVEVADRLLHCIRPSDTVARLGGDEFTILLDDITDTSDAITCVQRIQAELSRPFIVNGNTVFSGSSIGVVIATETYTKASDLLRDADIAMYRAKEGRTGYELFNQDMYAQTLRRLKLENDLRLGLARHELQLYYQPIISLVDQRLLGFEALVRWLHPVEGMIQPDEFVSIAEETGLIVPIGKWVLEQATYQAYDWQQRYPQYCQLKINVNVASQQIRDPMLLKVLDDILDNMALAGNTLRLELTEGALMQQTEETIEMLQSIRQRDVQISIDDFGTGYSSLSYLSRFPINNLKIDRSFVSRMHVDGDSFEIVRTIATLAHTLGMDVTAEGIELDEQVEQLKNLGCEFGQGFLFSQPLNALAAEEFLASWGQT